MSKGNERLIFRIDPALNEEMEACIAKSHTTRREEPWTVSDFIRIAIREKLDKMERSRNHRKGTSTTSVPNEMPDPVELPEGSVRLDVDFSQDDDDELPASHEEMSAAANVEEQATPDPESEPEVKTWRDEVTELKKATRSE